jgi:hypothetical protein
MRSVPLVLFALLVFLLTVNADLHSQWKKSKNSGANVNGMVAIAGGPTGTILLTSTLGYGAYRSTDNGLNWTVVNTGLTQHTLYAITAIGTSVFVASQQGGFFMTTNAGDTWTIAGTGLPATPSDTTGTAGAFSLVSSGSMLYAGGQNGVFKSGSNGAGWKNLSSTPLSGVQVIALLASGSQVYAGGYYGLFGSSTSGSSWGDISAGLIDSAIVSLAMTSDGKIVAGGLTSPSYGYSAGLAISGNKGASWTDISNALPFEAYFPTLHPTVQGLAAYGTNIFAGLNLNGVYLSTNTGTSWLSVNTGYTDSANTTALYISGPNLYALTTFGVWYRSLSEMVATSVAETPASVPEGFALLQNYPNPFNPTTRIAYMIPSGAGGRSQVAGSGNMLPSTTYHIRLTIYDLVGRQVAVLVDGVQQPGMHEVVFDARNLPSGVYFYRLSAGNFVQTRRLTLVK